MDTDTVDLIAAACPTPRLPNAARTQVVWCLLPALKKNKISGACRTTERRMPPMRFPCWCNRLGKQCRPLLARAGVRCIKVPFAIGQTQWDTTLVAGWRQGKAVPPLPQLTRNKATHSMTRSALQPAAQLLGRCGCATMQVSPAPVRSHAAPKGQ